MIDVKPSQVWDVRENEKAPWREAKVIDQHRDVAVLQFLDMPNATDAAKTFNVSCRQMLSNRKRYRLVSPK